MKIVKYIGGLGNQMFIFAFSFLLHKKFNETIYADTFYYKDHKFHNGLELERIFNIHLHRASVWKVIRLSWFFPNYYLDYHLRDLLPKRKTMYTEPADDRAFKDSALENVKNRYYFGFWQDHRYYDGIKEELIKAFKFKLSLSSRNTETMRMISTSENSVGIHVRRGDYVTHPAYKDICTIEYYQHAIELINTRLSCPSFYIFSNDIDWCRSNIEPLLNGYNVQYVDWNKGNESYVDMQLMSQCKNLIIANSSFSWWAAYLNPRNPFVIAPDKWVNKKLTFRVQLDEWHLI